MHSRLCNCPIDVIFIFGECLYSLHYYTAITHKPSTSNCRLKHPNIVQLLDVFDDKTYVYLVMEL